MAQWNKTSLAASEGCVAWEQGLHTWVAKTAALLQEEVGAGPCFPRSREA